MNNIIFENASFLFVSTFSDRYKFKKQKLRYEEIQSLLLF